MMDSNQAPSTFLFIFIVVRLLSKFRFVLFWVFCSVVFKIFIFSLMMINRKTFFNVMQIFMKILCWTS